MGSRSVRPRLASGSRGGERHGGAARSDPPPGGSWRATPCWEESGKGQGIAGAAAALPRRHGPSAAASRPTWRGGRGPAPAARPGAGRAEMTPQPRPRPARAVRAAASGATQRARCGTVPAAPRAGGTGAGSAGGSAEPPCDRGGPLLCHRRKDGTEHRQARTSDNNPGLRWSHSREKHVLNRFLVKALASDLDRPALTSLVQTST